MPWTSTRSASASPASGVEEREEHAVVARETVVTELVAERERLLDRAVGARVVLEEEEDVAEVVQVDRDLVLEAELARLVDRLLGIVQKNA